MQGFLKEKLELRKKKGTYRRLGEDTGLVDFLSNDYLGLGRSEELGARIHDRTEREGFLGNGGTGSRLLSGNHKTYDSVESYLANLFEAEACLVFNSGYAANQALVSSVASRGDTILYDRLSHVCLKEGAWLSKATSQSFEHNDLSDLEFKLSTATGNIFVISESVFSMDGDEAPLQEMISLCKKFEAHLIVDEAHSTGTFGENGAGWLIEKGIAQDVFARVYTFGKAMGVHGACVAGSSTLIDYLINYGRTFIYTTSLPPHSVLSIEESFRYLTKNMHLQSELKTKIDLFKSNVHTTSESSIQPILIAGNEHVRKVASKLQESGFNARPIVAPTVREGEERMRICLHTFNDNDDIVRLASVLNNHI